EPTLHTFQNVTDAIRAALTELGNGQHDMADLTRVAAIGHAWGGMLVAQYAAQAAALGLPVPSAIMPAMPGCDCDDFDQGLDAIPTATKVVVLVSERDSRVGELGARVIFKGMTAVPPENR